MIIHHRNQSKPCEGKVRPPFHFSMAVVIFFDSGATLTCFNVNLSLVACFGLHVIGRGQRKSSSYFSFLISHCNQRHHRHCSKYHPIVACANSFHYYYHSKRSVSYPSSNPNPNHSYNPQAIPKHHPLALLSLPFASLH